MISKKKLTEKNLAKACNGALHEKIMFSDLNQSLNFVHAAGGKILTDQLVGCWRQGGTICFPEGSSVGIGQSDPGAGLAAPAKCFKPAADERALAGTDGIIPMLTVTYQGTVAEVNQTKGGSRKRDKPVVHEHF